MNSLSKSSVELCPLGRRYKEGADSEAVLKGSILLFDILSDDRNRGYRSYQQNRMETTKKFPTIFSERRDSVLRISLAELPLRLLTRREIETLGGCHKQMDMIFFAVEFDEFSFKIRADVREDELQIIEDSFVKDVSAVLCDEDQMDMKIKNDMSAMVECSLLFHRPSIEWEKSDCPAYHANKESLPIRADAKRRAYPQNETVLRMCPFRIQSCVGVSESAV